MIKREKIEYIDGKPELGILVDWALVRKNFNKIVPLSIRKKYHNPLVHSPELVSYYMDLSDRDRGKTTNKLIIGLILFAMYGIKTVYMRTKNEDIERRNISTLYDVVLQYNYIQDIFGDEWNSIDYSGYKWTICRIDDTGKIQEKMPEFTCICMTTERAMRYKSRIVLPTADFIIYDEFIEPDYPFYTMQYFQQNLKTILRSRKSGVILMSSNAINLNSPWFADFKIRKQIKNLKSGENMTINVDGTTFFVEILPEDTRTEKKQYNRKYLGFTHGNSMQSITGGNVWEMRQFPHIDRHMNIVTSYARNIYVLHLSDLVNIEIVNIENIGLACFARPATKLYDDSIIFTVGEILDKRYIYKIGNSKSPTAIIWRLYRENKFYFATNEIGELLANYWTTAQKL